MNHVAVVEMIICENLVRHDWESTNAGKTDEYLEGKKDKKFKIFQKDKTIRGRTLR